MRYTWLEESTGNGVVTGLRRDAVGEEKQGTADPSEFTHGYVAEYYSVRDNQLVPMSEEEFNQYRQEQADLQAAKDAELEVEREGSKMADTPQGIRDFIDSKFNKDMTEKQAIMVLKDLVTKLAIRTIL